MFILQSDGADSGSLQESGHFVQRCPKIASFPKLSSHKPEKDVQRRARPTCRKAGANFKLDSASMLRLEIRCFEMTKNYIASYISLTKDISHYSVISDDNEKKISPLWALFGDSSGSLVANPNKGGLGGPK
jgi:hypothetical protein